MKPNASLKSRNVNCLVMASRPLASLQPGSLASALLRAVPVSFSAMVGTSWSPRLCHASPPAGHSQRRPERLPNREESRPIGLPPPNALIDRRRRGRALSSPGGPHVLVAEYRHDRWNGGACARHLPVVSGLDLRRQLGLGRGGRGLARTRPPCALVRPRGGARIRPHLHPPRLRPVDPRRPAASDP